MKKIVFLTALYLLAAPLSSCYMHPHNPQVDQVYQARRAEALYAHKLERRYLDLLSNLVPSDALRIAVTVELDFSQTQHSEITAPDEEGLLAESKSIKTHEKGPQGGGVSRKNQSRQYLATQHKHEIIDYPGHLSHLGVVVLVNADKIADRNPDELEEFIYDVLEALIPASLDDNEQIEIIITPFVK